MFGKQSYFHKKIFSKGKKHRIAQKVQQRKNEKKKPQVHAKIIILVQFSKYVSKRGEYNIFNRRTSGNHH